MFFVVNRQAIIALHAAEQLMRLKNSEYFLAFGFYRHRRFINDFCQHFSDQLWQGFRIRQPPKPLRQCPPVQRFTNWPIRSNASPASGRVGPNKCQTCSNSGQVSSSAGEPAALALFT